MYKYIVIVVYLVTYTADHNLHPRGVLIVNATNICTIDLSVMTGAVVDPRCVSGKTDNATLIDYSLTEKKLFFYDKPKKEIWVYDLTTDSKLKVEDVGDIDGIDRALINISIAFIFIHEAVNVFLVSYKNCIFCLNCT